jgi:acyl-CoA dehydrogenase
MTHSDSLLARLGLEDVYLDDEHRALRATLRRFVAKEIVPKADQWEEDRRLPREFFELMGSLGLLDISFPGEVGGGGGGVRGAVVLSEELGRSTYGGVATSVTAHSDMSALHLVRAGTEQQIERYLPGIRSGRLICGLGVTEPDASSDLSNLSTSARREGDSYVLNGRKTFITNANIADLFFVVARTGDNGRHGLSLFVVERGMPGLSNGRTFEKTGWRSSDLGELVFTDCIVPAECRLGEEGAGFGLMMQGLDHERICLVAQSIGLAHAALDSTLEWVRVREVYGRPLWSLQAIRHELAAFTARLAGAITLLYHAAQQIDAGNSSRAYAALLKADVPTLVNELTYQCVQFTGGAGFVEGSAIERISRDARFLAIGGGSTEVMRDEVARAM